MSRDLLDLVRELNTLNDDNLADRVIENSDVQWCLSELQDILEEMPTLTPPNEPLTLDSRLTPKMVSCPKGWKGVRDTRFYCPGCKKAVKKGEAYCHKCGQSLIFPIQRYDKENNRIWLDFSNRRPPEGEA